MPLCTVFGFRYIRVGNNDFPSIHSAFAGICILYINNSFGRQKGAPFHIAWIVDALLVCAWYWLYIGHNGFFMAPIVYILSATLKISSLVNILFIGVGLLVLLPFIVLFSNSATPGKPLLRKRLQFFAILNLYLMTLSLLYSWDSILYYIWSLPSFAVMLTYIFSLNITRFSKYYFILVNMILLSIAPLSLWLIH